MTTGQASSAVVRADDEKRPAAPPRPAWVPAAVATALTVAVALVGAWLGLAVAGTTSATVGPLGVDVRIDPALTGATELGIDPIGTLVLDSHDAPMAVRVRVTAVDVERIRALVDDPTTLASLDDTLVADLRSVLVSAGVRSALVAVLGAGVAGLVVLRSWRRALLSAAVAVAGVSGSYAAAWATFDPQAIREPQFTGLLSTAPSLVGSAESIAGNFDAYADQLAGLVTNVGKLYQTGLTLPTFQPGEDTIRLLHVSDLHLNPAAWDVIDAVAEQYDVAAIVDAGDIADHGTAPESRYVAPIGDLERPYVYVRGNHDSILTQAAVAAHPNAVVLTGEEVQEVAGLRFLGLPDPRFTPDQTTRGTAQEDLRLANVRMAEFAADLEEPPDVLLVHDPTHAELFDGSIPLVLAGHAHRRREVLLPGGTRVMVQGSTGGAGLRALEGEEPTPVMLSVLYLEPETKDLLAWDDITLGGLGLTSAQIDRRIAEQPAEEGEAEEGEPTAPATPAEPAEPTAPAAEVAGPATAEPIR